MKKSLCCFFIVLIDIVALAQLPQYVRNPITTNTPAGVTNVTEAIIKPDGVLTAKSLVISNSASHQFVVLTNGDVGVGINPPVEHYHVVYSDTYEPVSNNRYAYRVSYDMTMSTNSVHETAAFLAQLTLNGNVNYQGTYRAAYFYLNNWCTGILEDGIVNRAVLYHRSSGKMLNGYGYRFDTYISSNGPVGSIIGYDMPTILNPGGAPLTNVWGVRIQDQPGTDTYAIWTGTNKVFHGGKLVALGQSNVIGNFVMGELVGTGGAYLAHTSQWTSATYALRQTTAGGTIINAKSDQAVSRSLGGTVVDTAIAAGIGIKTNSPKAVLHVNGDILSGSNITANGFSVQTNPISAWPTAPRVPGETFIGNSNGWVYMLSSKPGATGWGTTNRISGQPRWTDSVVSGLVLRAGGSSPQRTLIVTGVYGNGWNAGEDSDFTLQFPHGVARTNIWFPDFYFSPHLHVSAVATNAGTNAAFVIKYQYSRSEGAFSEVYTYTNWIGFTQTNKSEFIQFTPHTNNLLSGADSLVIRGNISCITNTTGKRVIVDSADVHVPVVNYGSEAITGD